MSYFSCPANHGIFVRPTQVATSAGGAGGAASPVSPGDEKWKRVKLKPTVDGNQKSGFNSPVDVGSFFFYYLQGFLYYSEVVRRS